MNASVYLLAKRKSNYFQCPNDHTSSFLRGYVDNLESKTCLWIHRDANLMHYTYLRNFGATGSVGFSLVLNGSYLPCIDEVFSCFENLVARFASEGVLIKLTDKGGIESNVTSEKDLSLRYGDVV